MPDRDDVAPDPEADRRRLDWLEARADLDIRSGPCPAGRPIWYRVGVRGPDDPDYDYASEFGPTLRAAIDAAMRAGAVAAQPPIDIPNNNC